MPGWVEKSGLAAMLNPEARGHLLSVHAVQMPKDTILFHPGDAVRGFAIVLAGRVGVYLTGAGGRDILLFDISPGQTCIQSTLGILGNADYSAEAVCETDCELAPIPRDLFECLMDIAPAFRTYVFGAFASRMQTMMQLLEQVAFEKIETRLARALLARASEKGIVNATHQELATQIGSAREVISRRLDLLSKQHILRLDRGAITVLDIQALARISGKPRPL